MQTEAEICKCETFWQAFRYLLWFISLSGKIHFQRLDILITKGNTLHFIVNIIKKHPCIYSHVLSLITNSRNYMSVVPRKYTQCFIITGFWCQYVLYFPFVGIFKASNRYVSYGSKHASNNTLIQTFIYSWYWKGKMWLYKTIFRYISFVSNKNKTRNCQNDHWQSEKTRL